MQRSNDSDSAEAYCVRLAQQIRASGLAESSWKAAFHREPPPLASSAVEQIAGHLEANPKAQARLAALVQYPPGKWLLEQELAARGDWPPPNGVHKDVYQVAQELDLQGICFSGGGIRSATFNLGVLQGLASLDKLKCFDYLSTVSGGGYIHQFLASWMHCEDRAKVQEQLSPIPGPPSTRTAWPEPLRWLRRYSNYLTPQVGLFSADTWVAFSIWLRNTFLNQVVLVSTMLLVLLLPHFHVISYGRTAHFFLIHGGVAALVVFAGFAVASGVIFFTQLKSPPMDHCHPTTETGMGQGGVLACIFLPILIAVFFFSPYLYRSAFWSGVDLPNKNPCPVAIVNWPASTGAVPPSSRLFISHLHRLGPAIDPAYCGHMQKAEAPADPPFRLRGFSDLRAWQTAYSFRWWSPLNKFDEDTSTSWVFTALLLGIALLVFSSVRSIPRSWKQSVILLAMVGALGSGYVLIQLSRILHFATSFLLPLDQVTRVAIPLLPPLVLGIIFLSIEIAGGLVGNLVDESVREWFARLRAWSFLFGIVWFALTACSLLGPRLVSYLLHVAHYGRSVWIGWIGTTLVSVLAGNSSLTSGTPKDAKSRKSRILNILALIGPPVFIAGLLLTLSAVVEKALTSIESQLGTPTLPHVAFFWLFALLAAIALLFGWRIDINEFSLHAFYRDRLARCYAGGSDPDRRANPFTGFASSDKRLRLADLLPVHFGDPSQQRLWVPDCDGAPQKPTYQGPFPIFCAALNLSFGEDLAYQERKAGAFAFTPLYCGYDIGWTEADTPRIQFNGYTPTRDFAFKDGGPHMATAVAASGAAISPNWGYHSSPTMAFLLTIFNVRLGLWIRNPRHKYFRLRSRGIASSPWFGLFYLAAELFGMVNDAAAFVYLTDGGHFENMGLYELVRRHCSTIVVCDAEQDGDLSFQGIGMAIRKCRIDFGAEIDLDISKLELKGKPPVSPQHFVEGTIRYPNGATGSILYIKSTFTSGLPADLINYHKEHPAFPNDTTLDQWFTESQFESYRRLGHESIVTGGAATWLNNYL
ncbi:MAG: apolipoprotein N-acyltransferase [Edaphobacter sp.]|nr:apolipoprotein N-acyltransferase [Edaphobacter sp.]